MKNFRFVVGSVAAITSQPDVLLNIGRRSRKRISLRFIAHQVARHSSCSVETATSHHWKAYKDLPTAEEPCMVFGSANSIIQPSAPLGMIKKYFNVSKSTAYRILVKDDRLKNCDVYTLSRNMNLLRGTAVDPLDVRKYLMLLYRCPLTTEHNVAILKEMGLSNLKAEHLTQFAKLFKSRVLMIKTWGLLPKDYDPLEVLASVQVPDHVINSIEFHDTINNMTLGQLHQKLSSVFLSWSLNCSKEEIDKLLKKYRITKKSIKLQYRVLTQLNRDWNIHASKVLLNGYLLMCSPVNLNLIHNNVKQICGVNLKEYVLATPRILTIPYHQLLQVDQVLSKLQTPEASLKSLPRICTLHPDTLQERINHLKQIPEFSALQSHPRVAYLVFYHNKVTSRLNQLQQVKNTDILPSLNTLSGTKMKFSKYLKVGDLRKNKRDIIMMISRHLSVNPDVIRKHLYLQNWGSQTTVVNVQRNIVALQELGFSDEQILSGLDVVLYPSDLLHDQLVQLPKRSQVQPFSEFKSRRNVLQLLLYFMEKNASFH